MGKLFSCLIAATSAALIGCGGKTSDSPAPGGNTPLAQGQSGTDQSDTLSYRMVASGCDTGPRKFANKADLCENIQIDINNNNCAQAPRKYYFDKHCSGQWDPAAALSRLQSTHGMRVSCTLSEWDPTSDELSLGVKYVVKQDSVGAILTMTHEDIFASANQAYFSDPNDPSKNHFDLTMMLYDAQGVNLGRIFKSFKEQESFQPQALTVPKFQTTFICTPSLQ